MSAVIWTPAQALAIRTEGRDLLVAAGAGAGKTTVLVERILHKLRDGVVASLDEILVVTFTEKAAREMKSRIYAALARDDELRRHLPELPRARISTIHAFCARTLRENFLAAGVEPGFRVLDEHGRTEALEEALRQTFHRWYLRTDRLGEEFQRLVELAGFDEDGESLRLLVRRLHEFARTTTDPRAYLDGLASPETGPGEWAAAEGGGRLPDLPPAAVSGAVEGPVPWLEALEAEMVRRWTQGTVLYAGATQRLENAGYEIRVQREVLGLLRDLPDHPLGDRSAFAAFRERVRSAGRLAAKGGFTLEWGRLPSGASKVPGAKDLHDTAKKLIDPVATLLTLEPERLRAEEVRRQHSLQVLVRLVREMDANYEAYKRRGGWLDYADLEIHAARVLSSAGDLALDFQEVLVDEYQDVNALQERILGAVARPGGSFRVGDVKQSIYGFRLADPTIFLALLEQSETLRPTAQVLDADGAENDSRPQGAASRGGAIEEGIARPDGAGPAELPGDAARGPAAIYMNENYRSQPGILRFVNEVFGRIFDARTIGSDYEEQALSAGRSESAANASGDRVVELHLVDIRTGDGFPTARQLALSDLWIDPTELEPRYVARRLRSLAGDPALRGEGGRTDWSRVAILLRSATRATTYADALRREGIPAELGGSGSLFTEPIVRDLRSVLRAIDNPRDDVALTATLRVAAFGFGPADLLRIRLAFPGAGSFLDAVVGVAYAEHEPIPEALLPMGEEERLGSPDENWHDLVPPGLRARAREVLDRIVAWRSEEGWSELASFLARIADQIHLVPFAFAGGEGARDRACLERFLQLAHGYEAERGPSLHGFLARLDLLEEADAVATITGGRGAEPGVHILTIHRSKGLEFPVVVVPQLDWRVSTKDRLASRIRIDRDWVGLRWFDAESYTRRESVVRQLLEWRQEEALREEDARILYVAMTRAEERLLLFGMQRHLPAEEKPDALWAYERRHASSMLSWIVGALPWSRFETLAGTPLEAANGNECAEITPAPLGSVLHGLGLLPAEVPTLAAYHARLGGDVSPLEEAEMAVSPPAGGEYGHNDLRVCRVSKIVLAAELAAEEAARRAAESGSAAAMGSAAPSTNESGGIPAAPGTPTPEVGETYDLFAPIEVQSVVRAEAVPPAEEVDWILSRVLTRLPHPPVARLGSLRGKYWVTEFKSVGDGDRHDALRAEAASFWPGVEWNGPAAALGAHIDRGPATVDEARAAGVLATGNQDRALRAPTAEVTGTLWHAWLARVPIEDLAPDRLAAALASGAIQDPAFAAGRSPTVEAGLRQVLASEWGARLRAAGPQVEREVPFSIRWRLEELRTHVPALDAEIAAQTAWSADAWSAALDRHWVLLQGRLDCVFPWEGGWVVLDWKTDRVDAAGVDARAARYASQMTLYRDAVARLWGRPVTSVLAFLACGELRVAGS